ncbi:hypothetical protein BsWGS_12023 [Bradybaena similaris]
MSDFLAIASGVWRRSIPSGDLNAALQSIIPVGNRHKSDIELGLCSRFMHSIQQTGFFLVETTGYSGAVLFMSSSFIARLRAVACCRSGHPPGRSRPLLCAHRHER